MGTRDQQGQTLFTDPPATVSAPAATADLLKDAAEAAGFLRMGDSTEGMSARTLAEMRGRLLDAVHELERRWTAETTP